MAGCWMDWIDASINDTSVSRKSDTPMNTYLLEVETTRNWPSNKYMYTMCFYTGQ